MADDAARVVAHLLRALEEFVLAAAAGVRALEQRGGALERARAALRAEERRWASRAPTDPAAARVREVFAALADLLEPRERETVDAARDLRESDARGRARFDRPRVRWDTRARWRS